MEIWAHRGRTSPEQLGNSLRNFLHISRLEITGFETDICFTLDQKIIIYHPGSTEPDLTQMLSTDINNSIFNVMYLEEFLDLIGTMPDLEYSLDIKQNSEDLVMRTIQAIIAKNLQNRIYLTAFQKKLPRLGIESDASLLIMAKTICPDIRTHMIVIWPFNLPKLVRTYHPDAISIGWLLEPKIIRLISKSLFKSVAQMRNLKKQIRETQNMGVKVWAGIFNNPNEMIYSAQLGIDGIITDEPKILIDLIKKQKILV